MNNFIKLAELIVRGNYVNIKDTTFNETSAIYRLPMKILLLIFII